MRTDRDFNQRATRLAKVLHRELGLGQGDLATRVARSRRRLPGHVKRDVLIVAEAAHLSGHPRIAPQIDRKSVDEAYIRAMTHLRGPQMAEMRKGRLIGAVTALAVNLGLVFVLVIAILVWRDFV